MNGLPQNAIARTARVSKHSVQNVLVATRGRVAAGQAGHIVQVDAAGADGPSSARSSRRRTGTRGSVAGCMPTPSWTGSCTTRSGSTWARPTCGSAADRPIAIKRHRGQCRPRCPGAISAVPFRDIQQCSSEQILILELNIALLSTSYSSCAAIPMDAILGKAQQLQVDKQACH